MTKTLSILALMAGIGFAGAAFAQDPPAGGLEAKGNAPIKQSHTVNDGAAKTGANSFTQNEARKHILNSGYTEVSGLTKGKDGVWRGTAIKGGAPIQVGLDFKGNVSEGGPSGPSAATTGSPKTASAASAGLSATGLSASSATIGSVTQVSHRRHHRWRHHHVKASCANPGPDGAACSGADRNRNGISDKEDRAIKAGAKP